jgi:hypothetical protein
LPYFFTQNKGNVMALNDIAIKNAEIRDRKYRIRDTDKLFLEIFPNGAKGWRVRYWRNGKETMISLGNYPAITLKEARTLRDEINVMLAKDIDPVTERKRKARAALGTGITFQEVCNLWLTEHAPPVWSESHYEKQVIRINKQALRR